MFGEHINIAAYIYLSTVYILTRGGSQRLSNRSTVRFSRKFHHRAVPWNIISGGVRQSIISYAMRSSHLNIQKQEQNPIRIFGGVHWPVVLEFQSDANPETRHVARTQHN